MNSLFYSCRTLRIKNKIDLEVTDTNDMQSAGSYRVNPLEKVKLEFSTYRRCTCL